MNKQQALEILGLHEGASAADITAAVAARRAEIVSKKARASSDALAAVFDTFLQRLEQAEDVLAEAGGQTARSDVAAPLDRDEELQDAVDARASGVAAEPAQTSTGRQWWWAGGALAVAVVAALVVGLFLERIMLSRHQLYVVMLEPGLSPDRIGPEAMEKIVVVDTELRIVASASATSALIEGEEYNEFLTEDADKEKFYLHYKSGNYFAEFDFGEGESPVNLPMYPLSRVDIDFYKDKLIGERESFLYPERAGEEGAYTCEISYGLVDGEVESFWYEEDGTRHVDGKMEQRGQTLAYVPTAEDEDTLFMLEYVLHSNDAIRFYLDVLSDDLSEVGDFGLLQQAYRCEADASGNYRLIEPFGSWWEKGVAQARRELLREQNGKVALTIDTVPNASIYILNIKPKYTPGMLLEPGEYHIRVEAEGYYDSETSITVRGDEPAVSHTILMAKYAPSEKCKSGNCYNGSGTFVYDDGSKYSGEFRKGVRHGQGTYYYTDGNRYEGAWVDGDRTGKGTFYWMSGVGKGDRYVGDFVDNKRTGKGIYYYGSRGSEGDRYEGDFVDGKRHGYGTYYPASGKPNSGYLINDEWQ